MIVTYFRSSSYGCHDMCNFLYTIEYVLGLRGPSGKKAVLGSIVHKGLEFLANIKLCQQNGLTTFQDDETNQEFDVGLLTPKQSIDIAFDFYSAKESHHEWLHKDRKQCHTWLKMCMDLNDGMWNPLNRDVVKPEQYFDIPIDEPWAKYKFTTPEGQVIEGQLAIKGTVDLVTRVSDDTLEYLDWKTGQRLDWATGAVKDYKKLRSDPQLRIYYYALRKLYPDIANLIMTIVFVRDGGAFAMPFGDEDIPRTLEMLRKKFESIKDTVVPRKKVSWRCKAFCHQGRTKWPGSEKTRCDFLHDEFKKNGLTQLMLNYGTPNVFSSYGDGGGKSNRDEKVVVPTTPA